MRPGVGLLVAACAAMTGCATPTTTAAQVPATMGLRFELDLAGPAPAQEPAAAGIEAPYVGSPFAVVARDAGASAGQAASETSAAAAAPPAEPGIAAAGGRGGSSGGGSGGSGGGQGSTGGVPTLPLPVGPAKVNPHMLDRVAGAPVAEGPLSEAMRQVAGVAVDPDSGMVFACDFPRHQIRAIAPDGRSWVAAGSAASTAGFDGDRLPATATRLANPVGLAFDVPSGALLVADGGNRRVRYFQPGGLIYTLAGGGTDAADTVAVASEAAIGVPFGVASDAFGHTWFTERDTGRVRRVTGVGVLETIAVLPGGKAGAVAVQAATGHVWVTDDRAIYLIDPERTPALQPAPIQVPQGLRITALIHDQRDALIMATTSDAAPGTTDTRIWRIPLDREHGLALGDRAELLAGHGSSGSSAADYVLPAPTVPDATQQLLAGAGFCSLAVDWTHQLGNPSASGLIYGGTSYATQDPSTSRAEVYRLTPTAP